MSDLSKFTEEELREELESRKKEAKEWTPRPFDDFLSSEISDGFEAIYDVVVSCMQRAQEDEYWDGDAPYYIYEKAMEVVIGSDWVKIKSRICGDD